MKKTLILLFFCAVNYLFSQATVPITCNDSKAYILMQETGSGAVIISSMYNIDMITGATNLVKNPILPATETRRQINAFGYNAADGFLYGYRNYTNQIVKIDKLGNYDIITVPALVTADVSTSVAGDVYNGSLYLFNKNQAKIFKINLTTLVVTVINFTIPSGSVIGNIKINDFSIGPDGNIYGILEDKTLFKINLTTNTLSFFGTASGSTISSESTSWGTAFLDAARNLYVGNNTSRNIYKFIYNTATNTYNLTATLFTTAATTAAVQNLADGASCAFKLPPNPRIDKVCLSNPAVNNTIVTDVLSNDILGTYGIDASSLKLIDPVTSSPSTSVTIPGQGTYTVNTTTGEITFVAANGFTNSSINYFVSDVTGNVSSNTTLTITTCPALTCTSESPMLNPSTITAAASGGSGAQYVIDNDVTEQNYWQTNGTNQSLTIDYKQNYTLSGFTYYPSTGGSTVLNYTVQTSTDNITFTTAASGSFSDYTATNLPEKGIPTTVRFTNSINARFLRMIVAENGKRVAEIIPLVCGATPVTITCNKGNLLSTAINTTGTAKKNLKNLDNNWTVTQFSGGTADPTTSTYNYSSIVNSAFYPAVIVGQTTIWWGPSTYANAEWISPTQNGMDINSPIAAIKSDLPNTYFFKYKFDISDPLLAASLKLRLDYLVDNVVVRVYVNGIDQNINSTDFEGYLSGSEKSMLLERDFQTGTNELVIQVYSGAHYAGLLVQGIPSCYCLKDPTPGPGPDTRHGITLLKRAGADNNDNWPMIRKSAHTVLESNSKGFVPTRMATADLINITTPVEGMMVFDTTVKCLKIYNGTEWKCFMTPACPQDFP